MAKLRVLEVSGTPHEMGYQHGKAFLKDIHELTEDRIQLSSTEKWTGYTLPREQVLALGEACLEEHRAYSPELVEELEGIAEATGLGLTELLIMNGFTDFIDVVANHEKAAVLPPIGTHAADNCTAFIVSSQAAAEGKGFIGQTWDMHDTATPYVILLRGRPANAPEFLVFTITGCVGMIGMNDAGIAMGINNLTAADGRIGVTWPFVIRKALMQTNLDDALACITGARLAGAHNYVLADSTGRGYNVEAMSTRYYVEEVQDSFIVHTNHCVHASNIIVERKRLASMVENSHSRYNRAAELLSEGQITVEALMALTRDRGAINGICVLSEAPFFVETSGAAIMRPATREFWAAWGPPINTEYERFVL